MKTVEEAVTNLNILSAALGEAANRNENYNTEYASYLENISWEMYKYANELRELKSRYGMPSNLWGN